jgi:hypothetical protein
MSEKFEMWGQGRRFMIYYQSKNMKINDNIIFLIFVCESLVWKNFLSLNKMLILRHWFINL